MILRSGEDTRQAFSVFDSGMTVYLWDAVMNGDTGDQEDTNGSGDWFNRFGRRVVFGDDRGFVYYRRFATVEEAVSACDEQSAEWWPEKDDDGIPFLTDADDHTYIEGVDSWEHYVDRRASL